MGAGKEQSSGDGAEGQKAGFGGVRGKGRRRKMAKGNWKGR